jgi:hypothetical protein
MEVVDMRYTWIAACAVLLLGGCGGGGGERAVPADAAQRAQESLGPFKKQLMGALTEALAESPVRAIEVCSVRAPAIAEAVAQEGLTMGRSSHRLRNPSNAAPEWAAPMLEAWVDQPANALPRAVWIDDDTIGYVEPIYTGAMCLTCHGEAIADSVAARIDELYAADEARGFREGDFRGIFWVTMDAGGR